jgi:putative transposase
MLRVFQSFLAMIAASTDRELAYQLQYLKTENRILRSKLPKRLPLTHREKQRLIRFGKPIWIGYSAIDHHCFATNF